MPKDLAGAVLLLLVAAGYYALAGGINPSALDDGVGAAGIPFIYAALVAAMGLALAAKAAAARWFGRAASRLADVESRRLLGAAVMLGIGVAYVAVVAFLDPLRKLVGDGRLTRHKLAGQSLYCAADRAHQTHQLRARRLLMATRPRAAPARGRPCAGGAAHRDRVVRQPARRAAAASVRRPRSAQVRVGRRPAHRPTAMPGDVAQWLIVKIPCLCAKVTSNRSKKPT